MLHGIEKYRFIAPWCLALVCAGCWQTGKHQIVVYTALDREFSEPIFEQFESRTGIQVLAKYDAESTKTVGLTNAILAEAARPRCDVFWNNEILNTLRLKRRGLLATYHSPVGVTYPPIYRDRDEQWYGFAGRARVLLVNTERVAADARPDSILDLADPQWRGQIGIGKPLFGTTASHATILFQRWGERQTRDFFARVRDNCADHVGK